MNAKQLQAKVVATGSVGRRVRHDIMKQYFEAAGYFADCAASIEDETQKAALKDKIETSQHRAYVVGAVVLAAMAMETCINGIYLDACSKNLKGLDDREMALLAKSWAFLDERHLDTLFKYMHALLLVGKRELPPGENPYQGAKNLIDLRNALTHYKPEWDDAKIHETIKKQLKGRFDVNPLAPDAYLWFPEQCLGSGCAKWAVNAAEDFVRAFCKQLGIPKRI
jgi:hypothetical protein